MRWALVLAAICACSALACGDTAQVGADAGPPPGGLTPEQAARVVARVGDVSITLGDYAAALERMDPYDRLRYQTVEKRRELLSEMVDLELLAIEAKKRGLDKKPEAEAAVRQVLRDALLEEARKELPTPAEIPMAEVRAYYDQNVVEFKEPERRRVSAIVMEDETKAKEVLAAAVEKQDPSTWGNLFFQHSVTAPKDKQANAPLDLAGDLGVVGPPGEEKGKNPRVPEPLREVAFKLARVGDVHGELITIDKKFYIVRLAGRTQAHERSFAETERQIRVELLKVKMRQLELELEKSLRQKYKVEVDEAALAAVDDSPPAPSAQPSSSGAAP